MGDYSLFTHIKASHGEYGYAMDFLYWRIFYIEYRTYTLRNTTLSHCFLLCHTFEHTFSEFHFHCSMGENTRIERKAYFLWFSKSSVFVAMLCPNSPSLLDSLFMFVTFTLSEVVCVHVLFCCLFSYIRVYFSHGNFAKLIEPISTSHSYAYE